MRASVEVIANQNEDKRGGVGWRGGVRRLEGRVDMHGGGREPHFLSASRDHWRHAQGEALCLLLCMLFVLVLAYVWVRLHSLSLSLQNLVVGICR